MKIQEDLLNQEIEHWEGFCNNYESLADSVLVTALAYFEPEKREEKIKAAIELLDSLLEPLNGTQMLDSLETDIEYYKKIDNEAKIALRTLNWVKEIEEDEDVDNNS